MKRTVTASIVLACLTALLLPGGAEARKPPKLDWRSRLRQFPSNQWCPVVFTDSLPEFKADGASATVRFVVDGQPGQRIDNVYVVEKSVYETHVVNDDACGGLFFDPASAPVAFLETFDSEANGWRRVQVSWNKEDNGNGALFFDPKGLVAVVASGLKKGTTYVVGASWYTDNTLGAVLNIRVDPGDKQGCGSDKAADGFEMLLPEE